MSPRLTLYLANVSCAFVPHSVLLHFDIPVKVFLMKFGPKGVEAADGSMSNAEYRKINPLGFVPALDAEGEVITEIPAILNYISTLNPEAKLFSDSDLGRVRVAEWLNFLSARAHAVGFSMTFLPGRYIDDTEQFDKTRAKGRRNIEECLLHINKRLEGRIFAVGNALTAADFYLYIFARWAKEMGFEMEKDFPNYAAFARRTERLEGVREAVKRQELVLRYAE
ncbi:hypothetical protein FDECE_13198 [Fusarium decemcellulare]|nr:hypothetical protein FDECE_13198 [Fusarium decemcellulare]